MNLKNPSQPSVHLSVLTPGAEGMLRVGHSGRSVQLWPGQAALLCGVLQLICRAEKIWVLFVLFLLCYGSLQLHSVN